MEHIQSTVQPDISVNKCEVEPDVPLLLFILFCFFTTVVLIAVKTYRDKPPSVATMSFQSFASIMSSFLLIIIGTISVYAEWGFAIFFILFILFVVTGLLDPTIFFYQRAT